MKKLFLFFAATFIVLSSVGQIVEPDKLGEKEKVEADGWSFSAVFNLNFAQTYLSNWAAGGQNTIALNSLASIGAKYKEGKHSWVNSLDLGYGVLRQGKGDEATIQKIDDKIDLSSKYGYELNEKLYVAGLLSFKTQFADGFEYPDDSTVVSGFMAPGYLLGAVGIDYKPIDKLSVFFAPVTTKFTFVRDQKLADAGAFGVTPAVIENGSIVTPGENMKSEFGGYLRVSYADEVLKNVQLKTKLELFSNYLKNPDIIDVNWEVLLGVKINKYIAVSLSTQLLYDYDVKFLQDDGTMKDKIQFKEIFGVGLSYQL